MKTFSLFSRSTNVPSRVMWLVILLVCALLQIFAPILSDEAYFVAWGRTPAMGYYDHPPVTGWVSAVLVQIEDLLGIARHGIVHRLFVFACGVGMVFGLRTYFARRFPGLSSSDLLAGFAALPVSLIVFNFYMNDSIVLLFVTIFLIATERVYATANMRWGMAIVAGAAFGLALLTKYPSAVFWLGLVAYLISSSHGRRFLFGRFIVISLIAALPFSINLWWNYTHCAVNLAFNFEFRDSDTNVFGVLYALMTVVVVLGPATYFLLRRARGAFFGGALIGSVGVMILIAVLRGGFGVNWGIPLLGAGVLAMAEVIQPREARVFRNWAVGFGAVFAIPVLAVLIANATLLLDIEKLVGTKDAYSVNIDLDIADGSLIDQLKSEVGPTILATNSYGVSANLVNFGFDEVTVFSTSVFGRNQDIFTDFRDLHGRDVVFLPSDPEAGVLMAELVFETIEVIEVVGQRQSYVVIRGQGFDYPAYRTEMILPVLAKYYDRSSIPSGQCYMDKYR